jgi:hypothetical protein
MSQQVDAAAYVANCDRDDEIVPNARLGIEDVKQHRKITVPAILVRVFVQRPVWHRGSR